MPPAPQPSRLSALDGVRGLAIFAVLFSHLTVYQAGHGHNALLSLAEFSGHGVDLFFALSGFLIWRQFGQADVVAGRARDFWLRRSAKIVPVYALMLLVVYLLLPTLLHLTGHGHKPAAQASVIDDWPWYVAFASNLLNFRETRFTNPALDVSWSLAVEVQFYALTALLAARFARARHTGIWITLAIVAPVLRVIASIADFNWIQIMVFTPTRLDAFAAGVLLALAPAALPGWLRAAGLAVLPVPLFFPWVRDGVWDQTIGYTWVALCACALVDLGRRPVATDTLARLLESRPLGWLGRISYSVYLTHIPVRAALRDIFLPGARVLESPRDWLLQFVFYVVAGTACLGVGALVWRTIEKPAQNFLLRRLAPAASTSCAVSR